MSRTNSPLNAITTYSKFDVYEANIDKWESILRFAVGWGFAEVKALAIRHLERMEVPDIQRIILYTKYGVERSLLEPVLLALVKREEPLSIDEGVELGLNLPLKMAFGIMRAREMARSVEPKDKSHDQSRVAADVTVSNSDAIQLVHMVLATNDPLPPPDGLAASPPFDGEHFPILCLRFCVDTVDDDAQTDDRYSCPRRILGRTGSSAYH